ncbi:NERD domain-containing protein [Paenalkalicoccus suaedae]|uniref:NERD domain-containing protein n=1 Tax=Paenalkalicoccus suaedae TaxID=2592382 RepID=A0A859FJM8_9BACI|nr:nuclease-related domain-containing protein [Paenalkalicoccus suaedae]QKS73020.1 NERD domain-containing protein [Paenalkalicoccus suaedae]
MIIDRKTPPTRYHQYIALKERLDKEEFEPLNLKYLSYKSGYRGETSIDYFLKLLNHEELVIMHDVRLPNEEDFFQIDTLILARSFWLVIESKNYSGSVTVFPKSQQLICSYKTGDQTFDDPLEQVKIASRKLSNWFSENGCKALGRLPAYHQVVFTNKNSSFTVHSDLEVITSKYCRPSALIDKIEMWESENRSNSIPFSEVVRTATLLTNSYQCWIPDYMKMDYYVSKMKKGVICKTCGSERMAYIANKKLWKCINIECTNTSTDAHLDAIYHYALLINKDITNKQLRSFLNIESRDISYRILKSLELPQSGTPRLRIYDLSVFLRGEKEGPYTT